MIKPLAPMSFAAILFYQVGGCVGRVLGLASCAPRQAGHLSVYQAGRRKGLTEFGVIARLQGENNKCEEEWDGSTANSTCDMLLCPRPACLAGN
eukprot:COSAG01_NODE_3154_length_6492_cov_9.789301_4_plen_94_part_00